MSYSPERGWSGDPSRKRLWEETERARQTRERYDKSTAGIIAKLRYRMNETHKRRLAHGTRTP